MAYAQQNLRNASAHQVLEFGPQSRRARVVDYSFAPHSWQNFADS